MSVSTLYGSSGYIDQNIIKTGTHLTTKTKYQAGNKSISHFIDSAGHHVQNDVSGTKLLSFNHDDVLQDCALKQHVTDAVYNVSVGRTTLGSVLNAGNDAEQRTIHNLNSLQCNDVILVQSNNLSVNDSIAGHESRLTTLENSGGGGGGAQNIASVLNTGNNAGGKSISNLENLTLNDTLTVGSCNVTDFGDELHCDKAISSSSSLYAPQINADYIGCGNGSCHFGSNNGRIVLQVNQTENVVSTASQARLVGFSNLEALKDEVGVLHGYISQLKNLCIALSLAIDLKDSTGSDFDWSELII